jgi:hypothetical protein
LTGRYRSRMHRDGARDAARRATDDDPDGMDGM